MPSSSIETANLNSIAIFLVEFFRYGDRFIRRLHSFTNQTTCSDIESEREGIGWMQKHSDSVDDNTKTSIAITAHTNTHTKKCCKCHLMLKTPFDKLIDLMAISMTHRWKMNVAAAAASQESLWNWC